MFSTSQPTHKAATSFTSHTKISETVLCIHPNFDCCSHMETCYNTHKEAVKTYKYHHETKPDISLIAI